MSLMKRLCMRVFLVLCLVALFVLFKDGRVLRSDWMLFQRSRATFYPSLNYPVPGKRNIFFVETSCAVHDTPPSNYTFESGLVLPPRMACALEAAALSHPERPVYYAHTCPIDLEFLLQGDVPDYALAVFSLPNVLLWPVRFSALLFGSPLEKLIDSGAFPENKWHAALASNILRYFLLWKYGGTYLDTDVLVLKPFGDLRDFACTESEFRIATAAMDFSWEAPGRLLVEACLNEILHFDQEGWIDNIPGVISRAMKTVCGVNNVTQMDTESCHGFRLLPVADINPVPYKAWSRIFDDAEASGTLKDISNSFAIHVWNELSKHASVKTSSQQAYAQIARRVCPSVISTIGSFM